VEKEIILNGLTYVLKEEVPVQKAKNKFKDVFDCKSIGDLFEFAGIDTVEFLEKHSNLTPKKLNLEYIEKGIEIIRGEWLPTKENKWYYPYFERTPSGLSFSTIGYHDDGAVVPASLVCEKEEQARLVGNILLPQYSIWMQP